MESASGSMVDSGGLRYLFTTATGGSEAADLVFQNIVGGSLAESLRVTSDKRLRLGAKGTSGDPASCTIGDIYFNSSDGAFKGCTATDTWGGFGSAGGANTALSNLSAVAINASLLPGTDDAIDLGDNTHRWRDLYLGGETIHIGASTSDEATMAYNTSLNIFNISTDSTSNGDIAFFTDDIYLDKSAGKVGIGTTSPNEALTVNGNMSLALQSSAASATSGYAKIYASAEADGIDAETALLLEGNGTDASTTITDSSGNGTTVTATGNAQLDTTNKKFGTASIQMDGTGDYVTYAGNSTNGNFGSSDFTIDFWINLTAAPASGTGATLYSPGGSGSPFGQISYVLTPAKHIIVYSSTNFSSFNVFNGTDFCDASSLLTLSTFHHVAFVRSGNDFKVFINGTQCGSTQTSSASFPNDSYNRLIGSAWDNVNNAGGINGYIDEYRISKGIARWTTTFTPPTSQFSDAEPEHIYAVRSDGTVVQLDNASGSTYLTEVTLSDLTAADSTNTLANGAYAQVWNWDGLTSETALKLGSSSITSGKVFDVTSSAASNFSGSLASLGLSDGTGASSNTGSILNLSNLGTANANTSLLIQHNATGTSNYAMRINDEASDTTPFIVDGTGNVGIGVTTTNSALTINGSMSLAHGAAPSLSSGYTKIYADAISGGAGIDSDTKLLLEADGSNASTTFTDSSASVHTVTAAGNAQLDTTTKKFGTASMEFDGFGDSFTVPDSADWNFGSGDFTVDMWVYLNGAPGSSAVLYGQDSGSAVFSPLTIFLDSSKNIAAYSSTTGGSWDVFAGGTLCSASGLLTNSTWHHIAIVRNGTNFKIFINGTQCGSTATMSGTLFDASQTIRVGNQFQSGGGSGMNGFIDEYRVSKGIARWTTTFTPPTNPYSDSSSSGEHVFALLSDGTSLQLDNSYVEETLTIGSIPSTGSYTNALCWDNSGASEIQDCVGSASADYMEMYPTNNDLESGDVVTASQTDMATTTHGDTISKLEKTTKSYQNSVLGIVSDKTRAGDFNSIGYNIKEEDNAQPLALSGRVPVKVGSDSESISPGDFITTSSEPGKAMKATEAGMMIGKAIAYWEPGSDESTVMIYVNVTYADPQNASHLASSLGVMAPNSEDFASSNELDGNTIASITVSETFKSLGQTMLSDTTIAGEIAINGTLSISEDNKINALGTLSLQTSPLAEKIEAFNGLIAMEKNGSIKAKSIAVEEIKVLGGKTAGTGKIVSGTSSVVIENPLVKDNSIISITPEVVIQSPLAVTVKSAGVSFKVEIPTSAPSDIPFSYLIVNQE